MNISNIYKTGKFAKYQGHKVTLYGNFIFDVEKCQANIKKA